MYQFTETLWKIDEVANDVKNYFLYVLSYPLAEMLGGSFFVNKEI